MKKILLTLSLACFFTASPAKNIFEGLEYNLRIGYGFGGTIPTEMPASIRKVNKFTLTNNLQIGIDARKQLDNKWGVMAGIHFENKGMDEDARVKNYYMEIVQGGESLKGSFTGDVNTEVSEWMFTIPLQATFTVGKVILKAGPYFSYLCSKKFSGYAHNGYLREGDPTGPKILIGNDENTKGDYDFSDNMRRFQWGVDVGADWYFSKKLGVFADLSWGLSDIYHSSFRTIEQTLYPIYATIGVAYKLK